MRHQREGTERREQRAKDRFSAKRHQQRKQGDEESKVAVPGQCGIPGQFKLRGGMPVE